MFVTNQRTRLRETITIDGIRIDVKDSFKVLGVTLENNLGFSSFINSPCCEVLLSPQKDNINSKILVIRSRKIIDSQFRYK